MKNRYSTENFAVPRFTGSRSGAGRLRRPWFRLFLLLIAPASLQSAVFELLGEWPGYPLGAVPVIKAEGQRLHLGVQSPAYGGYFLSGAQVRPMTSPSAPGPISRSPWPWGGTAGTDSALDLDTHRLLTVGHFDDSPTASVRLYERLASGELRQLGAFQPDPRTEQFDATLAALAGRYAIISGNRMGIQVLDTFDPAHPVRIRNVSHPKSETRGHGLVVRGSHAYLATLAGGTVDLWAYSLADLPGFQPATNGQHKDDQWLQIGDGYAYVPTPFFGLHIFSLVNPAVPERVRVMTGDFPELSDLHALRLRGNRLFVTQINALVIYDVSQPADPVELGRFPLGSAGLEVIGDHVYVGNSQGLTILNAEDPTDPKHVESFSSGGEPLDLQQTGSRVYFASSDSTVQALSITDPTQIRSVAQIPAADGPAQILAQDRLVLMAGNQHEDTPVPLRVVEVDAAGLTRERGSLARPYRFIGVPGPPGIFYIGSRSPTDPDQLGVVDARVPGDPDVLPFALGRPGQVSHIAYAGSLLCTLSSAKPDMKFTLSIFDVSNPLLPVVRSVLAAPNDFAGFNTRHLVQIHGHRLYFFHVTSTGSVGIEIFDIADPAQPVRLGRVPANYPLDFAASDPNRLWLLTNQKLQVLDVEDPMNPREVGTFSTGRSAQNLNAVFTGLATDGTNASLLHREMGLWIVGPAPLPLAFSQMSRTGDQLRMEWTPASRTILQRTPTLESLDWQDVEGTRGVGQLSVPTAGTRAFYRLRRTRE